MTYSTVPIDTDQQCALMENPNRSKRGAEALYGMACATRAKVHFVFYRHGVEVQAFPWLDLGPSSCRRLARAVQSHPLNHLHL